MSRLPHRWKRQLDSYKLSFIPNANGRLCIAFNERNQKGTENPCLFDSVGAYSIPKSPSNSFCSVYTLPLNGKAEDFVLQKEEVSEVKWCDQAGLMRMVSENQLYNYGDAYFRMLFSFFKGRCRQAAAQETGKP